MRSSDWQGSRARTPDVATPSRGKVGDAWQKHRYLPRGEQGGFFGDNMPLDLFHSVHFSVRRHLLDHVNRPRDCFTEHRRNHPSDDDHIRRAPLHVPGPVFTQALGGNLSAIEKD
jgi:hypothetical protein